MLVRPVLALCLLPIAFTAMAADEKWEITAKMEMTGMPMLMPTQKITVCVPPGQMADEKMIPEKDGCKLTSFKTRGNTSTFSMQCPPPQNLAGEGRIVRDGSDAYAGTLTATGNLYGQAVEMKTSYAGRKIGPCDGSESVNAATALQGQPTLGGAAPPPGAMSNTQRQEQLEQLEKMRDLYGR